MTIRKRFPLRGLDELQQLGTQGCVLGTGASINSNRIVPWLGQRRGQRKPPQSTEVVPGRLIQIGDREPIHQRRPTAPRRPRATLDQVVGVRVPAPQLSRKPSKLGTLDPSTIPVCASAKCYGQSMGQREVRERPRFQAETGLARDARTEPAHAQPLLNARG